MAHAKQASKQKRRRTTLPLVGAAGASLAMAGGASAAAVPAADLPSHGTAPFPVIVLGEEEISDVSLATFYVFDRENAGTLGETLKLAARAGGGCRGCGGGGCAARGCAARAVGGCAAHGCAARGCAVRGCRGCRGCGVGFRGCAGCGCSCSGCAAPCWLWSGVGWAFVC